MECIPNDDTRITVTSGKMNSVEGRCELTKSRVDDGLPVLDFLDSRLSPGLPSASHSQSYIGRPREKV